MVPFLRLESCFSCFAAFTVTGFNRIQTTVFFEEEWMNEELKFSDSKLKP